MNHFRKVSHPCLTTRGFTALRCPFGVTLSLVRHGLASFDLQTFLRTKTVNKKVSTFKGALTRTASVVSASSAILSILIDYNCAVFLISKELLKRCPTRVATLVGLA